MRVNQTTGIITDQVVLVPYEAHHVVKYHRWMEDPAIQEATASDPLTLQEEYENQQSWRTAHDKLTFIICEPLAAEERTSSSVKAKVIDADDRMIGDINLFIYQDDESEVEGVQDAKSRASLRGEIDVMIADSGHRRKGYGTGSVQGMLIYLRKHLKPVLEEYTVGLGSGRGADMVGLMVKIKEGNAGSRRLFESLGFKQSGDVNYFGEVMLVISWGEVESLVDRWLGAGDVYREVQYEA